MDADRFCHMLIGPPGSGKSTLAQQMQQIFEPSCIVSTDRIRQDLYGDEATQGPWPEIEAVVLHQMHTALAEGKSIIYDATNAKRVWRMGLLQALNRPEIDWVGWQLTTPLEICGQWNRLRDRTVPETVLAAMGQALQQFPPIPAEGFVAVYPIDPRQATETIQTRLTTLHRSITNRKNRTHHPDIQRHRYSGLLACDRLLHLISLLVAHPGLGQLHRDNPAQLVHLGGEKATLITDSLGEICQVMAYQHGQLYADPIALGQDLDWLEQNGFLSPTPIDTALTLPLPTGDRINPHPYSDWDAFQRLLTTLRFITHHPFPWDADQNSSLKSLVQAMQQKGLLQGDRQAAVRKDFEQVLKPFGILPGFRMRRGYFIGTGLLTEGELLRVASLLQAQARNIQDPIALSILETLKDRLQRSQHDLNTLYPVRAIAHRAIVNSELLPTSALARSTDALAAEIEAGQLLELKRFAGVGRFDDQPNEFFQAWPLQIVFHNIGWYLGYEIATGPQAGLLQFERLDRLFRGKPQPQRRDATTQLETLERLQKLHQACGGLYLGRCATTQRQFLSRHAATRAAVSIQLELWFTDRLFAFICEGTQRFPRSQMKMSPKPPDTVPQPDSLFSLDPSADPVYPHRLQVQLPRWCLEDRDLRRWILGFGPAVKVISPTALVQEIRQVSTAIAHLYGDEPNE